MQLPGEAAIGDRASSLLLEWTECFCAGRQPFDDSRPAVTAFGSMPLEDQRGAFPHPLENSEERAIKWLIIRRVVLGVAKQFRVALGGERKRLEALLIAFLNIAVPEARTGDFISGQVYRRYVTTFRPIMTHHGLVPSSLARGPDHLTTLGAYEREWLAEAVRDEWPHALPAWWA